jgi:hypothetical protein
MHECARCAVVCDVSFSKMFMFIFLLILRAVNAFITWLNSSPGVWTSREPLAYSIAYFICKPVTANLIFGCFVDA